MLQQEEASEMGAVTHVLAFGAGYVAGTKVGDRPITAARDAFDRTRSGATDVATRAREMASRVSARVPGAATSGGEAPGTSIDLRQVSTVMTPSPTTVDANDLVRDAASALERDDIGSVIVTQDDRVQGIITDRDIALRVVAAGRQPSTTKVVEVMTRVPATIEPTATVQEAVSLMRQNDVRRLPVVEGGHPVGILALADLSTSSEARELLADISAAAPNN